MFTLHDDIVRLNLTPKGLNNLLFSLGQFAVSPFLKVNVSRSKVLILKGNMFRKN